MTYGAVGSGGEKIRRHTSVLIRREIKGDEFGSLHHLEIIDCKYNTVKVTFSQSIQEIDKNFAINYRIWGAVNLKEWIDNYESSRYTPIDEYTAIITSEYNMEHITEWLAKNTLVRIIDHLN